MIDRFKGGANRVQPPSPLPSPLSSLKTLEMFYKKNKITGFAPDNY